jgi:hypothetical protein
MTDDEDAFYHGKMSSKKGIKGDGDYEISKTDERCMPVLRDVVWVI